MEDKMNSIIPYYIVDLGTIYCNELRHIVEFYLKNNPEVEKKVEELKLLID